jgi:uncharacterized protein YlxW (UPF0749 family)
MGKYKSQITVAIVCCILGFMLTYQFKMLSKREKIVGTNKNTTEVTAEIEQYKKQKETLEKSVSDLQAKVKKYEDAAANKDETTKNILDELENTRILIGSTDVQGPGIIVYISPITKLTGAETDERITDRHLAYVVNELRFAGAEAISINDYRVTAMTGIRNSGNLIKMNANDMISPSKRITIKAVGNKTLLYTALSFPETFDDFKRISEIKIEKSDSIKIDKYNQTLKTEFAKPVK